MGRLFAEIWMLCAVSFLAGAVLTWIVFFRPRHRARRRWRDGVPAVAPTPPAPSEPAAAPDPATPVAAPPLTGPPVRGRASVGGEANPVPRPTGDPAMAGLDRDLEPSRRPDGNGVPAPPGPPPARRRPG